MGPTRYPKTETVTVRSAYPYGIKPVLRTCFAVLSLTPNQMRQYLKELQSKQQQQGNVVSLAQQPTVSFFSSLLELQCVLETLKSSNPITPEQQQQILQIVKQNPHLISALIHRRQMQEKQHQVLAGHTNITREQTTKDESKVTDSHNEQIYHHNDGPLLQCQSSKSAVSEEFNALQQQINNLVPIKSDGGQHNIHQENTFTRVSTEMDSKKTLISTQVQLIFIIHARNCMSRDKAFNMEMLDLAECTSLLPTERNLQCTLPYCKAMKHVLNHMNTCQDELYCSVPLCLSSRKLLFHWIQCTISGSKNCRVCLPLRIE